MRAVNLGSSKDKAKYWRSIERRRIGFYRSSARLVKYRFRDELGSVLADFDAGLLPAEGLERVLAGLESQRGKWEKAYDRIYVTTSRAFAALLNASIKASAGPTDIKAAEEGLIDVWTEVARDYAQTIAAQKITGIQDVTRRQVQGAISAGIDAGESMPQIATRIRAEYRQFNAVRAIRIARTEVIAASNLGSRAGALSTGLNLDHEWLSAMQPNRTRDDHMAANGQRVPIDLPFEVGGYLLMFPGDSSRGAAAEEVINCRCTEVYNVIK